MLTGTIVNSLGILGGCAVGLLLGKLIPAHLSDAVTKAVALCVLYIGVSGSLAGEKTLVMIVSMLLGTIVGELLRLDDHIHALGDAIERRFAKSGIKGRVSKVMNSVPAVFFPILLCRFL